MEQRNAADEVVSGLIKEFFQRKDAENAEERKERNHLFPSCFAILRVLCAFALKSPLQNYDST